MKIVFIMFMFILMILLILLMLNFLISKKINLMREKMTSFECGFELLNSSRLPFSIQFYLIGVLFLIFDIEVVLLFPFINSLNLLYYKNWMFSVFFVLMILMLGLEYEKNEGSLKWSM